MPGDSAPLKLAGLGFEPVTEIAKFPAFLAPPLSLMTCLMTVRVALRVFVIVQTTRSPYATENAWPVPGLADPLLPQSTFES